MSGKAPIEMKIGELLVKLSPLTLNDLESFEGWVKSERLRLALDAVGAVSGADRAVVIKEILSEPIDMYDLAKEMDTVAGACRLLWLCAVKNDAELKIEAFTESLSMENMSVMQTLINKLSMGIEEGTDTDRPTDAGSQAGEQS